MLEHNPDYLTINQIPFPYYPEDKEQVLQGGENIKKYLASSLPNKEEQQTFWEYFGYCMTQDTQFQKFLTLKGNGGTGESVAVSLIQHVVGITNMSSISLQDLNKRFYATGMYGVFLGNGIHYGSSVCNSTEWCFSTLFHRFFHDSIHVVCSIL